MNTVESDIKTTEPTPEQLAAAKAELDQHNKTRKKSWGEKAYDWLVYQGIGFGANEVGSMYVTGKFERSNNKWFGRPRFEAWANALAPRFKGGASQAKDMLMTASLNLVGCFVVPAIKLVDGYKSGIVTWLNDHFASDGLSKEQIDARDKEVKTAIACEPSQTWGTLTIGRIISMCFSISNGTWLAGRRNKETGLSFNDKLKIGFDEVSSAIGRNIGFKRKIDNGPNYYSGQRPLPASHEVNAFHYYAGLVGPETMGCAITSFVLEGVSKFTAKNSANVSDPKFCTEAVREIAKRKAIASRGETHVQGISAEEATARAV